MAPTQRTDEGAVRFEGRRHRSTLGEDRGVALLRGGVDDAGFRSEQTLEPGACALGQLPRVGTGGQAWQQLGDPVVEGVALLEEHAVDLGAKLLVGRDRDRGQHQREGDLSRGRVDSH